MEIREIVTVAVPVIAGIIWLIRLEGRVNTHEAECTQRENKHDERHVESTKKLDRIEAKLDRVLEAGR